MTTKSFPVSFPDFHPTPGRPAHYDPQNQSWQVFRYTEVMRVLSDHTTFSSERGKLVLGDTGPNITNLNELDPPRHRKMRALLAQAFTPRTVATFEPHIIRLADDLLDAVIDRGEMDVISDFAALLPLTVIAEILGVPASDHRQLQKWCDEALDFITPEALKARCTLVDYFTEHVKRCQKQGGSDLINILFEAQIDGEHLTFLEIVGFCNVMIMAGNKTTMDWIGNTMACFDRFPDAMQQVLAEPNLLSGALEEVLRYLPPLPTFPRVVAVDTVIDEQEVKAGQWVIADLASANRDETQFSDPNTFDIRRNPNRHIALGHGIHFCLGAPLARLEAKNALRILFERLGDIKRVPDIPLEAAVAPHTYGMKRFLITFKPK